MQINSKNTFKILISFMVLVAIVYVIDKKFTRKKVDPTTGELTSKVSFRTKPKNKPMEVVKTNLLKEEAA